MTSEHGKPDPDADAMLCDFLADRDEPCPLCGYNLRGLQDVNCPECGHDLALRVNLVNPVRGAYIAGLIGLACGLGFHALMLILLIVLSLYYGFDGGPGLGFFTYLVSFTFISASLLMTWVRRAAGIRRASRQQRALLAAGCWCVPLAGLLIMIAFAVGW